MITYLRDKNSELKIIKNKKEIIFDPMDKENICLKITPNEKEKYILLLKYFKEIANEYIKNSATQPLEEKLLEFKNYKMLNNVFSPTEINLYSDNSIPEFANILKIKKNTNLMMINILSKNNPILGDFVLLTSKDNYGKYGYYFEIICQMIDDIDKIYQKEKKLKLQ